MARFQFCTMPRVSLQPISISHKCFLREDSRRQTSTPTTPLISTEDRFSTAFRFLLQNVPLIKPRDLTQPRLNLHKSVVFIPLQKLKLFKSPQTPLQFFLLSFLIAFGAATTSQIRSLWWGFHPLIQQTKVAIHRADKQQRYTLKLDDPIYFALLFLLS